MSQYKSQLLSILGIMPSFPNAVIPSMFPATIMLNILGGASKDAHDEIMARTIAIPTAALHMYGKESKPARKIGHITIVGTSMSKAENLLAPLVELTDAVRAKRKGIPAPKASSTSSSTSRSTSQALVAVTMGSDSDLPVLKPVGHPVSLSQMIRGHVRC